MVNLNYLHRLLNDIEEQTTRRKRGNNEKADLEIDLEIIELKTKEALRLFSNDRILGSEDDLPEEFNNWGGREIPWTD